MLPTGPRQEPASMAAPLQKRRLSDEIYAQILLQLSTGRFEVGDRLPTENELAAMYKVSRPVVREALQHLQNDGLIDARRGAGTFVLRLPPREMAHHTEDARIAQYMRAYEVRQCLEPQAARLAATRINPTRLRRLNEMLNRFEAALNSGEDSLEADFQFHLEIARATGNDLFEKQMLSLKPDMLGTMRIALSITAMRPADRKTRIMREHRDIFEAISAGDGDLARLYMEYHLVSVRHRITDQGN